MHCRAGIIASSHVAPAPGGDPFIEIIAGTYTGAGGTNFTVTTALVPSDVVVVVYTRGTTSTSSVTGLGATWNAIFTLSLAADRAVAVHATGITGGGTITVNRGVAESGGVSVYVVRGLSSPSVFTEQHSVWDSNTTSASTDETTPSQTLATGQVAILVGVSAAGTTTFPSNPTPSSGWTVDLARTTARRLWTAHCVGVGGSAFASIRSGSTTNLGIAMIILG